MVLQAGHTGASRRQVFGLTKLHEEDLRNAVHSTNEASFFGAQSFVTVYKRAPHSYLGVS
jgi:hypothetical protein